MTRIYGWLGAVAGTIFLALWIVEGFSWGWAFALLAIYCAGSERVDLEASRRANQFLHEELDRLTMRRRDDAAH